MNAFQFLCLLFGAAWPTVALQSANKYEHRFVSDRASETTVAADEPEPFDCEGARASVPLQTIYDKDTGNLGIYDLNIDDGHYSLRFNATGVQNGCDISPLTSWGYCFDSKGVIARFGADKTRYVAKTFFASFSATFASDGKFYKSVWEKQEKKLDLYVIEGLDDLPGYENADDDRIADFTSLRPIVVGSGIDQMIADLGFTKADLGGGEVEYLVGLANSIAYLIDVKGSKQVLKLKFDLGGEIFGACWSFQDEVYFARNNGEGVVWLNTSSINLADNTVRVTPVGKSDPVSTNDGMNCHKVLNPFRVPLNTAAPTSAPTSPPPTAPPVAPTAAPPTQPPTAPPTDPIPQCTNCGPRPMECWATCGGKRGYCSACDSSNGRRGACCYQGGPSDFAVSPPGEGEDPYECKAVDGAQFSHTGYHMCVLTNE